MKKLLIQTIAVLGLTMGAAGCGNDFLDTPYNSGVDLGELNTADNIGVALNGAYYRLYHYTFLGNYALTIGDVSTDLAAFNDKTGHWTGIFQYNITPEDGYLKDIWNMGTKVVDNSSRVIAASKKIYEASTPAEQEELDLYSAEAHCLRAMGNLYLANIYCLPVKTKGVDNSAKQGLVVSEDPIPPLAQVSRATLGKTYEFIDQDIQAALDLFEKVGTERKDDVYLSVAGAKALRARMYLYLENWDKAEQYAKEALADAAVTFKAEMIYTEADYKAMYSAVGKGNSETIFRLAIDSKQGWSANSSGTLWTDYGYSLGGAFSNLVADTDIRKVLKDKGGKFMSPNPADATHYVLRIPELHLIIAECELIKAGGTIAAAQDALLTVAKRNSAIKTVGDLPSTKDDLLTFLKAERIRELAQEGHRFADLRRWGDKVDVYRGTYTNFDISKFCYPIPAAEINSGFGVEQNTDWSSFLPQ